MRRSLTAIVLFAALALLGSSLVFLAPAHASDESEADEGAALRARIEMIRKLPRAEQKRLRTALARFHKLSPERQREIRGRAKRVGDARLHELVGRDVDRLRKRHNSLAAERAEIVRLLGGSRRFESLTPVERKYLSGMAVREFQRHVRRQLLDMGGPKQMEEFNRLPRDQKKARFAAALTRIEERLLSEETPQSRAAILAMSPQKQRKMRKTLLSEYRMTLIPGFVAHFDSRMLRPFMRRPAELRSEIAKRWAQRARWFEMRKRLAKELGVSRTTIRLLDDMGPEEWARVRDVYVRTESEGLPREERRLRLETEIRELHGRSSVDDPNAARRDRQRKEKRRLRQLMRERRRTNDSEK